MRIEGLPYCYPAITPHLFGPRLYNLAGPSEMADDRLGCFRSCHFYGSPGDHEIVI